MTNLREVVKAHSDDRIVCGTLEDFHAVAHVLERSYRSTLRSRTLYALEVHWPDDQRIRTWAAATQLADPDVKVALEQILTDMLNATRPSFGEFYVAVCAALPDDATGPGPWLELDVYRGMAIRWYRDNALFAYLRDPFFGASPPRVL